VIASLRGHVADRLEYWADLAVELRPPTLKARLELLGGTLTADSGGLVVRIPIEPGLAA
jgi:hypothetical protein